MGKGKLTDPADKRTPEQQQAAEQEEVKMLDINGLSMADLAAVPQTAAEVSNPFDGYPMEDIVIGKSKGKPVVVKKTYIVVLSPTVSVFQDPSGKRVSVTGKDGREKIKTIPTVHNRIVWDATNKRSMDVVFDRTMTLDDGSEVKYAVVPAHWARAQLIYHYDKKIRVDGRYLLLDPKQASRLRKVFEILINPKLQREKLAEDITKGDNE